MMKKIKFILLWNTQKIDILLQKNTGNPNQKKGIMDPFL